MKEINQLRKSIRTLILFFISALILSGATAFCIETGLSWLVPSGNGSKGLLTDWLLIAYNAMKDVNRRYPFMAYGYDWLAFSHLVIAVAFIGPLQDPVKNVWIIQFGMIACCMIFPLAFIAGHFRQVPVFWQFIDCSFGLAGLIPLTVCHTQIQLLEKLQRSGLLHA